MLSKMYTHSTTIKIYQVGLHLAESNDLIVHLRTFSLHKNMLGTGDCRFCVMTQLCSHDSRLHFITPTM